MKRTTHRSTAGRKLYAKRTKSGKFTDIQTHKRASAADQRKRSKAEGTWVRYAVYIKSGLDAGFVLGVYQQIAYARMVRNSRQVGDKHRKWVTKRIEIHAGCPDPLRKRR